MNMHATQNRVATPLAPAELALLVLEENEILLERIVIFQDGIETILTTSLDHGEAIAGVEEQLRMLVTDLNASLARIAALNTRA